MKFVLPILAADGREFADARALDALLSGETSGHYLLGNHRKWHGGIHISDASAPWCRDKHPVRAMADGKVVAVGGADLAIPANYRRIDAAGKFVTPGIIDIHSHLGDYPSPSVQAHSDGNEATAPITAQAQLARPSTPASMRA